jgi:hypothetical protein
VGVAEFTDGFRPISWMDGTSHESLEKAHCMHALVIMCNFAKIRKTCRFCNYTTLIDRCELHTKGDEAIKPKIGRSLLAVVMANNNVLR